MKAAPLATPADVDPIDVPPAAEAGTEAPKRRVGRPRTARPRDTAPKPDPETAGQRSPGRPSKIDQLEKHLTEQFAFVGTLVFVVDPRVAVILIEDAPAHGRALAKLAEQNPKVRKILEGSLTGSAWLGVLMAFGSTGVKIAQATKVPPAAPEAPASTVAPLFPMGNTGGA